MCSRLQIFRRRDNGKVIFPLKPHLHTPNYDSSTLTPDLRVKLKNPTLLCARRTVLGLVLGGLRSLTFFLEEHVLQVYIAKHCPFSCWGKLEFCSWCHLSSQGYIRILRCSVICLGFSIHEYCAEGSQ